MSGDPKQRSDGGSDPERLTRDERRTQLLDAAATLIATESPAAVSMEMVAERAGVSRPLVYKHFANRDELLGALYRREARRVHASLVGEVEAAADVEGMFRALIRGALKAAAERGHVFGTLRSAGAASSEVRREQRQRDALTASAFTRRAVDEMGIDPELGPTTVALLLSLIDPVLAQWRLNPTPEQACRLEDAYMVIVSSTLTGLVSNAN